MTGSPVRTSSAPTPRPLAVPTGPPRGSDLKRVVIRSIGTAVPADAARVALGLGVGVPQVVAAFYRAPTALVDRLDEPTAAAMADLLDSLGCLTEVVPSDAPLPQPAPLLDVAVHLTDEDRFDAVALAVSAFLGCPESDARRLLLATPAVLLGGVSPATVEALRARLGEGVSVLASDPRLARYDLLLGDCPAVQRARLTADLRARGLEPATDSPWLLRGISKEQADQIWAVHQRTPGLQVVNQDFYLFEVVLDAGSPTPSATAALTGAGVPAGVVPQLFDALPIIVADGLSDQAAKELIAELATAGLTAHGELVTFAHLGVQVLGCANPDALRSALRAAGVQNPPATPPFVLGPWPELAARLLRRELVRIGAHAELVGAEEVPR